MYAFGGCEPVLGLDATAMCIQFYCADVEVTGPNIWDQLDCAVPIATLGFSVFGGWWGLALGGTPSAYAIAREC